MSTDTRPDRKPTVESPTAKPAQRRRYEAPRIQAMSEKEILNSFQITQSMGAWWTVPTC